MTHNIYLYIFVAAAVSCLIRTLPLTLIRGKIENPFIRSFLYIAGIIALIAGVIAAWRGLNMMGIAALCCAVVFICETIANI